MIEPVSDNILNLVNELYNNLDAKDKIINEQALEIARLKKENELIQNDLDNANSKLSDLMKLHLKVIEYIKPLVTEREDEKYYSITWYCKDVLLSWLGDKENE